MKIWQINWIILELLGLIDFTNIPMSAELSSRSHPLMYAGYEYNEMTIGIAVFITVQLA